MPLTMKNPLRSERPRSDVSDAISSEQSSPKSSISPRRSTHSSNRSRGISQTPISQDPSATTVMMQTNYPLDSAVRYQQHVRPDEADLPKPMLRGPNVQTPSDVDAVTPVPSSQYNFKPSQAYNPVRDLSAKLSQARNPHNPFDDSKKASRAPSPPNPFATPSISAAPSTIGLDSAYRQQPKYFLSRRVKRGEIEKPWLKSGKDKRQIWQTLIPMIGLFLGLALGVYMAYNGWTSIPDHEYCSVYEDDFSSGVLNPNIWTKEVSVGGFGNGQFEETTSTDENVFIADGMLQIKPTLQDEKLISSPNVLNLTALGTCTGSTTIDCVAVTNITNGTIINPVKSARITTRKGAQIKYGRIEVVAKSSKGDWLWPAIWMMPVNSTYGAWPQSGEIDIAEFRGNNYTYSAGGNNIVSSALHWGPSSGNDAWWRTYGKKPALKTTFADTFHTFGLEWSEKYIYMYLDTRLLQVMYNKFSEPFWRRGDFPLASQNGSAFVDPWSQTGNPATPFDQNFFLILDVAVGGTNGWFQDGAAGKPWVDASPTAKLDFWNAREKWYPTWTQPEMQVKSVKIWQQKGYNGC